MSLISEIKSIETEVDRNKNWLYHAFIYNPKDFENIITKGIKSSILRHSIKFGFNNGPFYISLSKESKLFEYDSAFWFFNTNFFNMIVEDVKAVPSLVPGFLGDILSLTPLPFRKKGVWDDEVQSFGIITPKKYVGIQCPLIESINNELPENQTLFELRDLIEQLKALGLDYPIYDYSRLKEEDKVYTIDKDEYLALTRTMHR